jgi:hypothetical protein
MKTLLTWVLTMTATTLVLGQKMVSSKAECDLATQRYIEQNYSVEDQLAIQNDSEQLSILNYMYSSSYAFAGNQMVLKSQKAQFDLKKYDKYRQQSCNTTVFDEASGLSVILYSWDEVDRQINNIKAKNQLASSPDN